MKRWKYWEKQKTPSSMARIKGDADIEGQGRESQCKEVHPSPAHTSIHTQKYSQIPFHRWKEKKRQNYEGKLFSKLYTLHWHNSKVTYLLFHKVGNAFLYSDPFLLGLKIQIAKLTFQKAKTINKLALTPLGAVEKVLFCWENCLNVLKQRKQRLGVCLKMEHAKVNELFYWKYLKHFMWK